MDNLQPMPSPEGEGQVVTPATSQGSEPGAQVPVQSQEPSVQQVEPSAEPSSQDEARKASEFETARQIKRLAKQMQSLQQIIERNSRPTITPATPQVQPGTTPISQQELNADPVAAIQRMLDASAQRTRDEIMRTFEQRDAIARIRQSEQDALKLIRTNESVKRDPQGEERIREILEESDDDGSSLEEDIKNGQINPIRAAKIALEIYKARFNQRQAQAGVPSKAQMASTATAVRSGAGKSTIEQEAADLQKMVAAMPNLMNDPAFRAKLDAFVKKAKMEEVLQT